MTRATTIGMACLLAWSTGCASLAARAPTADPLAGPSVVSGRLPNGFSYYILDNADPARELSLRLLVKAGAAQEDDDQRGAAQLVEHLAFRRNESFAHVDMNAPIERLRSALSLTTEAGPDSTQYRSIVPLDVRGALGKSLGLLRDIAVYESFEPTEIAQQQRVLWGELQAGFDAETRCERARLAMAIAGSRYADHLGPPSAGDIGRATPEALRRFHRDWYRPDTMALVAVGPVEPRRLVTAVERTFGALEAPARRRAVCSSPVASKDGLLISVVTDPKLTRSRVELCSRFDDARGGEAQLRAGLLQGLVTGLTAVRLSMDNPEDLAFKVAQTSFHTFAGGVQLSCSGATVGHGRVGRGVRALFAERVRAGRYGFEPRELEWARRQLLQSVPQRFGASAFLDSEALADSLDELFLMRIPFLDRTQLLTWSQELLSNITLADVNLWAADHAGMRGTLLLVSAPADVAVPTEAELRDWAYDTLREPSGVPSWTVESPPTIARRLELTAPKG